MYRRQFGLIGLVAFGKLVWNGKVGFAQSFDFSSVRNTQPGRTITLPPGVFDGNIDIEFQGVQGKRVTLRAATPNATVFRGTVTIRGQFGRLKDVKFENGGALRVEGDRHVVTGCAFENGGSGGRAIILANGGFHLVDRCRIQKWNNAGVAVTGSTQNCRIRRTIFDNRGQGYVGAAAVQLGLGDKDAYVNVKSRVEQCKFVGWDASFGSDKVLTIKSSRNVVRDCTFQDCDARVQVRYGTKNVFEACYLSNVRSMRILDHGNRILGCFIRGSRALTDQEKGLVVAAGNHHDNTGNVNLPGSSRDGHPNANATTIAGCDVDFTNVGSFYSGHTIPANKTTIREHKSLNPINLIAGYHSNTSSLPDEPYSGTYRKSANIGILNSESCCQSKLSSSL